MVKSSNIIALDIGEKRIGVARANVVAKMPQPIAVLSNDSSFDDKLRSIIQENEADLVIVGLPRSLQGQETAQTDYTRSFVQSHLGGYRYEFQDETLSSIAADERQPESKFGRDAEAACIILEDYFKDNNV